MNNENIYFQYMYSYPHKKAYYDIEEIEVLESLKALKADNVTLYIHIPFCSSKCGYCNLFSIPIKNGDSIIDDYIDAVCRHIKEYGNLLADKNIKITSLVIGGGTPLILSIKQMEKLFFTVENNFNVDIRDIDFVIETSPNETKYEKLQYIKEKGVKRISIGIQSFIQEELNNLYRNHDVNSCEIALKKLIDVKFSITNLDFIYGIKNQSIESLLYSINKGLSYNPEEIFLYPLYIRKDTALYNKMKVDVEMQNKMYKEAVNLLKSRGYFQVSMRRFVKEKPKNILSCGFETMISVGCGGRSYVGNVHYCEPYKSERKQCIAVLKEYIAKQDFFKGLKGYVLDKDEEKRRFIIKNLGYYNGINLEEYKNLFGNDIEDEYPILKKICNKKAAIIEKNRLMLTELGMGYSDIILSKWISDKVKKRMGL